MNARRLAFEVLVEVNRSNAFADALLGRQLARHELSPADRRLATLLVYGTLARQLTLDHTLAVYAKRPIEKLQPRVLEILRMGLFQLVFLDRIPAYAAVNDSVELARVVTPAAAGLVNAVLRKASTEGLVAPTQEDPVARMSIEVSHPAWLVERWIAEMGPQEAAALMAADNEPMPTALRAVTTPAAAMEFLRAKGHTVRASVLAPDGIIADSPVRAAGICVPQSEGSQLIVLLVGALPGDRVLDACAAPGGKTAYLAQLVGESGAVTAVDPGKGASKRIQSSLENARHPASAPVEVLQTSIDDPSIPGGFDRVLVDAPCSGLGTLREHPEIRWRRSPRDVANLSTRQLAILQDAAERVRPGGTLVYSTCTLLRAENDAVVDTFLSADPRFAEEGPTGCPSAVGAVCGPDGRLRTYPHHHDTGGFFAVRLRRR